jgi:hypothetical protein
MMASVSSVGAAGVGVPAGTEIFYISLKDPNHAPLRTEELGLTANAVLLGDHLYWLDYYYLPRSEGEIGPDAPRLGRVMTCRTDGTGRRIVWEMRNSDHEPVVPASVFAHRGRLYAMYRENPDHPPTGEMELGPAPPLRVARLDLDRSRMKGTPRTLMAGMEHGMNAGSNDPRVTLENRLLVDGGYLYSYVGKSHTNLAGLLSGKSTEQTRIGLYRIRLPE